jgi:hypothetical protein
MIIHHPLCAPCLIVYIPHPLSHTHTRSRNCQPPLAHAFTRSLHAHPPTRPLPVVYQSQVTIVDNQLRVRRTDDPDAGWGQRLVLSYTQSDLHADLFEDDDDPSESLTPQPSATSTTPTPTPTVRPPPPPGNDPPQSKVVGVRALEDYRFVTHPPSPLTIHSVVHQPLPQALHSVFTNRYH